MDHTHRFCVFALGACGSQCLLSIHPLFQPSATAHMWVFPEIRTAKPDYSVLGKEGGGGGRDSSQKKLETEWRWWGKGRELDRDGGQRRERMCEGLGEEWGQVRDSTKGQSGQTEEGYMDGTERIRKPK